MISKLVAWAEDRPRAIARMRRALGEYLVAGIKTTVPFFTWLLAQPEFVDGRVSHDVSRRGAEDAQRPAVRRADAGRSRTSPPSPRRSRRCCRRRRGAPAAGDGRAAGAGAAGSAQARGSRGCADVQYEVEIGGRPRQRRRSTATGDGFAVTRRRPPRTRSTPRASTRTRCRCSWTAVWRRSHEVTVAPDPVAGQLDGARRRDAGRRSTLNGRRRWGRKDDGGGAGLGAAARWSRRCRARSSACWSRPATRVRARQPRRRRRSDEDGERAARRPRRHGRRGPRARRAVGRRRRAARRHSVKLLQAPARAHGSPLRQPRASRSSSRCSRRRSSRR